MKLGQPQIDQIREAFAKMQTRDDLLKLMNKVKPLIYGDKAVPFELKQLTWFANPKISKKRYVEFKIKKKSGAERSIHAPVNGLMAIQKTLTFILQCVFEPHHAAHGFVRNKSIVDNAKLHAGSMYVYNIDLKDFFPSIDQARVWKCLQLKPFDLNSKERKAAFEEEKTYASMYAKPGSIEFEEADVIAKGRNVLDVQKIPAAPEFYKAKEGSIFFGKRYLLYQYNGAAFAVNENDPFNNYYEASTLWEVRFKQTAKGLKYVGAKTFDDVRLERETMDSSNSENESIIKYAYKGYSMQSGIRKIQLKNEGILIYKIDLGESDVYSGDVVIFKGKSKFKHIDLIVKDESQVNWFLLGLVIAYERRLFMRESRPFIANMLAAICCTEMEVERKNETGEWQKVKRNVLPQGAPTSPVLTNIVCQRLDFLLSGVAKRFGLKYSRYADDITFSSKHNVYQPESDFLKELHRIIAEQGFHIKTSKTRVQKEGYRQEVTGLLVNEKVNVQKRYIKQLRMWLYYWEKYGYEKTYGFFLQQYRTEKGHVKKGKPDMVSVIAGKLDYLKMVKGSENELYLKLKERFDKLIEKVDPFEEVLTLWEKEGIEKAMERYYGKFQSLK